MGADLNHRLNMEDVKSTCSTAGTVVETAFWNVHLAWQTYMVNKTQREKMRLSLK